MVEAYARRGVAECLGRWRIASYPDAIFRTLTPLSAPTLHASTPKEHTYENDKHSSKQNILFLHMYVFHISVLMLRGGASNPLDLQSDRFVA